MEWANNYGWCNPTAVVYPPTGSRPLSDEDEQPTHTPRLVGYRMALFTFTIDLSDAVTATDIIPDSRLSTR